MAKISMVGCGRLGAPVGMAWATKHDVVGYDVSSSVKEIFAARTYPYREPGAEKLITDTTMRIVDTLDEAVEHGDIVFVAVQTPHGAEYEGITRMPETRADFDYKALCSSVALIADAAARQKKHVTLVVISTVLPGTSQQRVLPLLEGNKYVSYVYAPMFIAQTTVVEDTLHPEFVLLGVDKSDSRGVEEVGAFFETFHPRQKLRFMSVASAELTKVAYNVFLGLKIVAANSIMEIAHKTGADCDEVSDALAMATDRVVSSKYMRGGMGDGGGCHPRDQIALAWLAQKLELSYDLFGSMVEARERQTGWIADLFVEEWGKLGGVAGAEAVILGKAYKRGTNLTVGSPALLLRSMISGSATIEHWDPYIDAPRTFDKPGVFLIATDHDEFYSMTFPTGSTIIDPWGKLQHAEGCKVIRVGRR